MKLFIGFIGRTRGGDVVEIIDERDNHWIGDNNHHYLSSGLLWEMWMARHEIIEEVKPELEIKMCDCHQGQFQKCPNGHIGSMARCKILVKNEVYPEPDRTQKVDVLLEALEFYANECNWDGLSPASEGMGNEARKALTEYKGSEND